jgi:hypothetical protein
MANSSMSGCDRVFACLIKKFRDGMYNSKPKSILRVGHFSADGET